MNYPRPDALVSTDWLAERLTAPDVRIVDGSFYLPAQKREPRAEFDQQHIPGAVFFDIDDIAEPGTSLPHMIPPPELFGRKLGALGNPFQVLLPHIILKALLHVPREVRP